MKTTIGARAAARQLMEDDNANWSFNGALALCEHLEQMEVDMGEEIEFDPVAIRCSYHQYENAVEAAEDSGWTSEDDDLEEKEDAALEYLRDNTEVIWFEGGIIVRTEF